MDNGEGATSELEEHGHVSAENVFELRTRNRENSLEINPFTAAPRLYDSRMDLNETVSALVQRE